VEGYAGQQFVGIDLHRRRSVIVRMTAAGEVLESTRIVNDADRLAAVLRRGGESPEVVLEATYGWYWAVDVLQAEGARVHLAHPLGVKAFEYRRVKNDERDSTDLADLLRMGRLPEAWIAPPATRGAARAGAAPGQAGRFARSLQGRDPRGAGQVRDPGAHDPTCSGWRAPPCSTGWTCPAPTGQGAVAAPAHRRSRVRDRPVRRPVPGRLARDPGYAALQTIPGIGQVLAAVFVAEIGDVHRFPGPAQLASWAGLTPKHHESDTHVHRGRITKQGSRLIRWAAVESVQILPKTSRIGAIRERVAAKRGRNIGVVAAARRQLELVFYALRDHHVRALHAAPKQPRQPHAA